MAKMTCVARRAHEQEQPTHVTNQTALTLVTLNARVDCRPVWVSCVYALSSSRSISLVSVRIRNANSRSFVDSTVACIRFDQPAHAYI